VDRAKPSAANGHITANPPKGENSIAQLCRGCGTLP